jgi:hypothetical protein
VRVFYFLLPLFDVIIPSKSRKKTHPSLLPQAGEGLTDSDRRKVGASLRWDDDLA